MLEENAGEQRRGGFASLTEAVYARLRSDLLAGRLPPGARLKVSELTHRLEANQGAVREALARLTADGFVETEPQRGYRVKSVSAQELTDLTTVRINVESECLRRSIDAGDREWESRVVTSHYFLQRLHSASTYDEDEWSVLHEQFHEALVSGGNCSWLLQLRKTLEAQSERYMRLFGVSKTVGHEIGREHERLFTAVLARDADVAVDILCEHMEKTTHDILTVGMAA